mmetsp:Transcript_59313/g.94347  ORF Transcript_59313/g.94347 Transcript_59313/m.94347 type:complete len:280 (+) Transcript_59313:1133-1972(+)
MLARRVMHISFVHNIAGSIAGQSDMICQIEDLCVLYLLMEQLLLKLDRDLLAIASHFVLSNDFQSLLDRVVDGVGLLRGVLSVSFLVVAVRDPDGGRVLEIRIRHILPKMETCDSLFFAEKALGGRPDILDAVLRQFQHAFLMPLLPVYLGHMKLFSRQLLQTAFYVLQHLVARHVVVVGLLHGEAVDCYEVDLVGERSLSVSQHTLLFLALLVECPVIERGQQHFLPVLVILLLVEIIEVVVEIGISLRFHNGLQQVMLAHFLFAVGIEQKANLNGSA